MNIASVQLADFLGEYLRILRRERDALLELEELWQEKGDRGEFFQTWQRILFLEVELQVAFERIAEVLEPMDLNPYIESKCRQVLLTGGEHPAESIAASLELLDRRRGLIGELQKFILGRQDDLVAKYAEDYVLQGFRERWERGLARIENLA